jgi:hypothetical protein
VSQECLEREGIELYSDPFGGYLFYCPKRNSFSSNGIFDFEENSFLSASGATTKRKKMNEVLDRFVTNDSRSTRESPSHPNMWNNANFTEKLAAEEKSMQGDTPGSPSSRSRSMTMRQKVSASEKIKDFLHQCCSLYGRTKENDNTWITSSSSHSTDAASQSKYLTSMRLGSNSMVRVVSLYVCVFYYCSVTGGHCSTSWV